MVEKYCQNAQPTTQGAPTSKTDDRGQTDVRLQTTNVCTTKPYETSLIRVAFYTIRPGNGSGLLYRCRGPATPGIDGCALVFWEHRQPTYALSRLGRRGGEHAFSRAGPSAWNSLPDNVSAESYSANN